MNYGMILYVVGWILSLEAVMMIPAAIVALTYREKDGISILITILICIIPFIIRLFV